MLELIETKDYEALAFFIAVRVIIILICWVFMTLSCIVDFWSGTTTAKALGEKLQSHGFRRTIVKIGDYVRVLCFALMFDALGSLLPFYAIPFGTILCTVAIICIEGKSVIENSRRKKTHAADIPEIVKQIVQASTARQGSDILTKIINELKTDKDETERIKH